MRLVVADASALVLLAKCGALEPATRALEMIALPVVRGEATRRKADLPDARAIDAAFEAGAIRVIAVRSARKLPLALGEGEAAAIRLCLQEQADAVLTDDGRGIRVCRALGISFVATPRLVVDLAALGELTAASARDALERLGVYGRYRPEILAAALAALQEVTR